MLLTIRIPNFLADKQRNCIVAVEDTVIEQSIKSSRVWIAYVNSIESINKLSRVSDETI